MKGCIVSHISFPRGRAARSTPCALVVLLLVVRVWGMWMCGAGDFACGASMVWRLCGLGRWLGGACFCLGMG